MLQRGLYHVTNLNKGAASHLLYLNLCGICPSKKKCQNMGIQLNDATNLYYLFKH